MATHEAMQTGGRQNGGANSAQAAAAATPGAEPLSLADRVDLLQVDGWRNGSRATQLLARTIDREVVPRLVLAERARLAPRAALVVATAAEAVAELVEIALGSELTTVVSFIDRMRGDGLGLEAIYLDILSPAVRQLGRLWDDDLADFGQVTVATERLRQVMRIYSLSDEQPFDRATTARRALLVPAPGDQHSFGLQMVAEFFGRAGWQLRTGVPDSTAQLVQMVRREAFAIIGFSVGSMLRLDALSEAIRKVRRASRNRGIGVMVGGPLFVERPELVGMVGADATAADGRTAVLQANMLLQLAPSCL